MKNNYKTILIFLIILFSCILIVSATSIGGSGQIKTVSVSGQTYSVRQWGGSSVGPTLGFWVWPGTDGFIDATGRERTQEYLGIGESYEFNTLSLKITLNSFNFETKNADFTLISGGGSRTTSCENECDNHNERWCSGNDIYTCYYDFESGCYKKGLQDTCGSTQKCENGYCKSDCKDDCSFSGKKCVNGHVYYCTISSEGCKYLKEYEMCNPVSEKCIDGECVQDCQSKYTYGCSNNNVWYYDSCGNKESIKERCENGCSNKKCKEQTCISKSSKKCYNNNLYWYDSCGNKENYVKLCSTNEKCENEDCVKIGQSECTKDQIKCLNENQYQKCKYSYSYEINEWGKETFNVNPNYKCKNNKLVYEKEETKNEIENKPATKKCSWWQFWCKEEIIENTEIRVVSISEEIEKNQNIEENNQISENIEKNKETENYHPNTEAIIFVHGWMGNADSWIEFQKELEPEFENLGGFVYDKIDCSVFNSGKAFSVAIDYYDTSSNDNDIEKYAERLDNFINYIDKECINPNGLTGVSIIAHSMGGIVSRKHIGEGVKVPVKKLITIATPNQGISPLAKNACVPSGIGQSMWDSIFKNRFNMGDTYKRDCENLYADGKIITSLSDSCDYKTECYTLAGLELHNLSGIVISDSIVDADSVTLKGAKNYVIKINNTYGGFSEGHQEIRDIPQTVKFVSQIIKDVEITGIWSLPSSIQDYMDIYYYVNSYEIYKLSPQVHYSGPNGRSVQKSVERSQKEIAQETNEKMENDNTSRKGWDWLKNFFD